MILVLLHYTKPLEEVDKITAEHRAYLAKHYEAGDIVCSGRRRPPVGGLILFNLDDTDTVNEIIEQDPFNKSGVAKYEVIPFDVKGYDQRFKPFLK